MRNGPRLNGSSAPVRLRVPSGNVRNELPCLSDSAARSMAANGVLAARAIDRHEAADLKRSSEQRQFRELVLEQHVQAGMKGLEQNGRVDVALMVAAEHHGAPVGQVFSPGHARADACERCPDARPPSVPARRGGSSSGRPSRAPCRLARQWRHREKQRGTRRAIGWRRRTWT